MAAYLHPTWQCWTSLSSNPQVCQELNPLWWVLEPLLPWDGWAKQNMRRWCSVSFCWIYSHFSTPLWCSSRVFLVYSRWAVYVWVNCLWIFLTEKYESLSTSAKYCLCNNQKLCYSFFIFPVKASLAAPALLYVPSQTAAMHHAGLLKGCCISGKYCLSPKSKAEARLEYLKYAKHFAIIRLKNKCSHQ